MFFFFNDTATTEIYTLSLHDALPISLAAAKENGKEYLRWITASQGDDLRLITVEEICYFQADRSEEHTSELQSRSDLVCRLLLEKKKRKANQSLIHRSRAEVLVRV